MERLSWGASGLRPERADRKAPPREADGHVLAALEALDAVTTAEQLAACLDREAQHVLPHGMLACGLARLALGCPVAIKTLLSHRFPSGALQAVHGVGTRGQVLLLDRWLMARRPVLLDLDAGPLDMRIAWPLDWLRSVRPLQNLAMHAVCDVEGRSATTFCFAGLPGRLGPPHDRLLRLLVPHLHAALERIYRTGRAQAPDGAPALSAQQRAILGWVQLGKTNPEVALIMGMSSANVKYHLRQVYQRLGVANRAHAVSRLAELGLGDTLR